MTHIPMTHNGNEKLSALLREIGRMNSDTIMPKLKLMSLMNFIFYALYSYVRKANENSHRRCEFCQIQIMTESIDVPHLRTLLCILEEVDMVTQYTPTGARKNLYGIIKDVTINRNAVEIIPAAGDAAGVAVIPLADWTSIRETLFLEQTGVLDEVRHREADLSGFTDVDELDWDSL